MKAASLATATFGCALTGIMGVFVAGFLPERMILIWASGMCAGAVIMGLSKP